MITFHHRAIAHIKPWFLIHRTSIITVTGISTGLAVIFVASNFAFAQIYQNKIYPGVSVGEIELGNFTQAEAAEILQSAYNKMLSNGLWVNLEGESARVDLQASGSDDPDLVYRLIDFDANRAAEIAMIQGRQSGYFGNAINSLRLPIVGQNIKPQLTIASDKIIESIRSKFNADETLGSVTDYLITEDGEDLVVTVVPGVSGHELDTQEVSGAITTDALDFNLEPLSLSLRDRPVTVSSDEASTLVDQVKSIIQNAPFTLTYTGEDKIDHQWQITSTEIGDLLEPVKNDQGLVELGLNAEGLTTYFVDIREEIDIEPVNARFVIEGDIVKEFQGSRDGVTLDEEETANDLKAKLDEKDASIPLVVKIVEPTVPTNQVNNLGITEILGVGTSDFGNSPGNRIENIKHGASKLNGLLIAPEETVSLLERLQPFTIEDGYLPELVIKGDEIKPEIGGGLCQIGTTTFRAVMNAGLDVVERRNHSLVVSYYNDPSNGKPGTDATIYDPAPDFKFKNNTGNYILLTTEMDMTTKELHFTFWGTSDGREGWYDPPTLLGWTAAGNDVRTETTDLAPGKEKCQAAHPGASTTFDYHVKYADGTQVDKTFASVYRSLPKICLVGVDKLSEPTTSSSEPPPAPPSEGGGSPNVPVTEADATATTDTTVTP